MASGVTDKLSVNNEMAKLDSKDRNFYDSLNDEEKKKFSPFLMIRYGATVNGSPDLQAYYLMSCNEKLNKHFFDISTSQHKKLQWLLASTISPGMGKQYHQWLAGIKKGASDNKAEKFLAQLYPAMKYRDIKLMAQLNSKAELKELAKGMGMEDKQIKDAL
jgi:hypothetical protein